MKIKDQKGKVHKIKYIPNINGFGSTAYVRVWLFKKITQHAAGRNVIENLVKRLEEKGWNVVDE